MRKKPITVGVWQLQQRPIVGHRSGKARCTNLLRPEFSVDGRTAFYACNVCNYRERRDYPPPPQLELELTRPPPPRAPLSPPPAPPLDQAEELKKAGERR